MEQTAEEKKEIVREHTRFERLQGDILPKFLYALVITLIVSILIYLISKILLRNEPKP